jgi:two-component system chemotaxis sensor kinase CheA
MNLDAAVETYRVESLELLDVMEQSLIALEHDTANPELINAIFRTAHTIKGTGGVFGFDPIVGFTHQVESLLDRIRQDQLSADSGLIGLLLDCADHIRNLLEPVIAGHALSGALTGTGQTLQAALARYIEAPIAATATRPGDDHAAVADTPAWHLSLRFDPAILQHGLDPVSLFNYLNGMGTIVRLVPLLDQAPPLAVLDPERCFLGFELSYRTEAPREAIESAFEFFREDGTLQLVAPGSPLSDYARLLQTLAESTGQAGELLLRTGTLTPAELERILTGEDTHCHPP